MKKKMDLHFSKDSIFFLEIMSVTFKTIMRPIYTYWPMDIYKNELFHRISLIPVQSLKYSSMCPISYYRTVIYFILIASQGV